MSTQPVRYSGYYDWFILLWPRHDHFSSWIKIKGVPFWKSNQFVVTQPNLQIIYDGNIFIFWQRSKVLSIKLWPKLKFWHWSPWCRVPVSISTAQFLVTCQIYGSFEGATLYLFCKNPRLGDNNCDQNWNFGTGLFAVRHLFQTILTYPWLHVNQYSERENQLLSLNSLQMDQWGQLHVLAWKITSCSEETGAVKSVIHLPLEPLDGWFENAVSSFWSLLTEYS